MLEKSVSRRVEGGPAHHIHAERRQRERETKKVPDKVGVAERSLEHARPVLV